MLTPLRLERLEERRESDEHIANYIKWEPQIETGPMLAWGSYDEPFEGTPAAFATWFDTTMPPGTTTRQYIEEQLKDVEHRIGLEVGGLGSRLFTGFSPGFFEKSIGVNLTDTRLVSKYRDYYLQRDAAINHTVVAGNMLDPGKVQEVDEQLDGRKATVIFERMNLGLLTLPKDIYTLSAVANTWYQRLDAERGIMLAQAHPVFLPLLDRWQRLVQTNEPNLELQVGYRKGNALFRLQRHPGSPDSLPVLSARTLMEERHQMRIRLRQS